MTPIPSPEAAAAAFREALAAMAPPVLVLGHVDADGLGATAILLRALERAGVRAEARLVGKWENAWTGELEGELRGRAPGGLVVADLGTAPGAPLPGCPTLVVDHHVPSGAPEGVTISGHGLEPQPTSSLLALWCAKGVAEVDDLLWLAALGLVGDMAEEAGFAEMAEARERYGKTALRDAAALVNAPRRTAAGDAGPALALLLRCGSPKELLRGGHPETALLLAAREEVRREVEAARRVPPRVRGDVALVPIESGAQVHPLIAQQWRGRLKDKVVICANRGYRPGWVHFAARTASGRDLIRFLAEHRPEGADALYGNGHAAASGGALRLAAWNAFVEGIGFPEEKVF